MFENFSDVVVQNHKARDPGKVVAALEAQGVRAVVMTDTTDYYRGSDRSLKYLGLVRNYYRCLTADTAGPWQMVVQDDVHIPEGAIARMQHVLGFVSPDAPVSFYHPTNKSHIEAWEQGKHVLTTRANFWIQCFCMPKTLAVGMIEWADKTVSYGSAPEDAILAAYLTMRKIYTRTVLPAFVQHEGYADSVLGHSPKVGKYDRLSMTYDPTFAVESVDWESEFADPYCDSMTGRLQDKWLVG